MIFEFEWDPKINSLLCEKQYHVKPRMDWAVTEYGADKLQAASNIIFRLAELYHLIFSELDSCRNSINYRV